MSFHFLFAILPSLITNGGHRGHDRLVVGLITSHKQSVPISTNVVSTNPAKAMCTRYNIM